MCKTFWSNQKNPHTQTNAYQKKAGKKLAINWSIPTTYIMENDFKDFIEFHAIGG